MPKATEKKRESLFKTFDEWTGAATDAAMACFVVVDTDKDGNEIEYIDIDKVVVLMDTMKFLCGTFVDLINSGVEVPDYRLDPELDLDEFRGDLANLHDRMEKACNHTFKLYEDAGVDIKVKWKGMNGQKVRKSDGKSTGSGSESK